MLYQFALMLKLYASSDQTDIYVLSAILEHDELRLRICQYVLTLAPPTVVARVLRSAITDIDVRLVKTILGTVEISADELGYCLIAREGPDVKRSKEVYDLVFDYENCDIHWRSIKYYRI